MAETNLNYVLFDKLLGMLFTDKAINIPGDFHLQCKKIRYMLKNDVTGVINTILDYAVDSASEATYQIECKNEKLEILLNQWLESVNIDLLGQVPSGIEVLAKEYFTERWKASSLCLLICLVLRLCSLLVQQTRMTYFYLLNAYQLF